MRRVLPLIFTFTLGAASLSASVVTGLVQTSGGTPVPNVDIDVFISSNGQEIDPGSGDTTDASGAFSIDIPDGTYDFTYTPELGTGLAGVEQLNQVVSGATALPTAVLPDGYEVTLRAIDVVIDPVTGINARFENSSAQVVFTPRNTTNASGVMTTVVPQSGVPYTLRLRDVGGHGFADKELIQINLSGDTDLGDITVGVARAMSGRTVQFGSLTPVANVNIDVFDDSGYELAISADVTDGSGVFNVTGLSDGSYDILFDPPGASGLAPTTLQSVEGAQLATLGDVVLGLPRTVSGRVVNGSIVPQQGVDLDFRNELTGLKVDTASDDTAADGTFSVSVPQGLYSVEFRPLLDPSLAPLTQFGVDVTNSVNLGDVVLGPALTISGTVTDLWGNPVEGADLDVFDPVTGLVIHTPGDIAGSGGAYSAGFASGVWDLVFNPPASREDLHPYKYLNRSVTTNQTLDVVLPNSSATDEFTIYR